MQKRLDRSRPFLLFRSA